MAKLGLSYRLAASPIWQNYKSCAPAVSSSELYSCYCLEIRQVWDSVLLNTDSGELSTERVVGRTRKSIPLKEGSPGDQMEWSVFGRFGQTALHGLVPQLMREPIKTK